MSLKRKTVSNRIDVGEMWKWVEERMNGRDKTACFYRMLLKELTGNDEFAPIPRDKLIRKATKENLWQTDSSQECGVTLPDLRDRFRQRVNTLNNKLSMAKSPYKDTALIIYNKRTAQYQLLVDPAEIDARRAEKTPLIKARLVATRYRYGLPILAAGDCLRIKIRSTKTGYIHVFHWDGETPVQKLFPDPPGNEGLKIEAHSEVIVPDVLREKTSLLEWKVEAGAKLFSKQKTLILVLMKPVVLNEEDVLEFFGQRSRVAIRHRKLADLTLGQCLSSVTEFWVKQKLNGPF